MNDEMLWDEALEAMLFSADDYEKWLEKFDGNFKLLIALITL